jgi:hypothetical protein
VGGDQGSRVDRIQGDGVLDPERSDRFPTEPSQMRPSTQSLAQVSRESPEISAGTHDGAEGEVRWAILHQLDTIDGNVAVRKDGALTAPRFLVAPLAIDVFG